MRPLPDRLGEWVADALDTAVIGIGQLRGGDVAEAFRVELVDGGRVFAKTHRSPPPDFFDTEAQGLDWLRAANAVRVPEVLAVTDLEPDRDPDDQGGIAGLVLEWIEEGSVPGVGAAFGQQLATVHRAGASCFGRPDRRTTGSRRLPNEPCDSWAEFYASCRLRPLARLAHDNAALDPETCRNLETVADRLDRIGGPAEPPARLHGDLWAGNRLVDVTGRDWLIDPAAHGGHREFDLAMMRLFGGFEPEVFDAYQQSYPLAEGWAERVALHQLAPLTVHAIKFGGSYRAATREAVSQLI